MKGLRKGFRALTEQRGRAGTHSREDAFGKAGAAQCLAETAEGEDAREPDQHFVLQIIEAVGLGEVTTRGVAVCVVLRVAGSSGELKGRRVHTLAQRNTASPVYASVRDLGVEPAPDDLVLVEVFADTRWTRLVAQGHIAASVLVEGIEVTVPLRRRMERATMGESGTGSVTLMRKPWIEEEHAVKRIFLLRHGQSQWNEARKDRRLDKLAGFDHPLTAEGVEQSICCRRRWEAARLQDLNSAPRVSAPAPAAAPPPLLGGLEELALSPVEGEEMGPRPRTGTDRTEEAPSPSPPLASDSWMRAFLDAGMAFSSPLTRAVQTAVLALHKHPTLMTGGLTLLRAAREVKGMGGLDVVGKAVGPEIMPRVWEKFTEVQAGTESLNSDEIDLLQAVTEVHLNDSIVEWWTGSDDIDTEEEVMERLHDVLATLQFAPGRSAILVGHSLFFRELIRAFVTPGCAVTHPQCLDLKLENAGCLGLEIRFTNGAPEIFDLALLFGSEYQGH
mmetsp:Transcript_15161/g.49734  ORF Transcript_15161/g.49734 Transcript_15161/m.49734 type:complete len:503 (-) Transcript_15161:390-1898(-)